MPTKKNVTTKTAPAKRLYRSETDRILGGVAGGIAEYFGVDSTLVRIIFLLLFFFGGAGFLTYLVLWVIIPTESKVRAVSSESIKENVEEIKDRAEEIAGGIKQASGSGSARIWFGVIVATIGLAFLFQNFGLFWWLDWGKIWQLWPLVLVIIGVGIVIKEE